MIDDKIIDVNNITKVYKLYHHPLDRLKESLSLSNKQYHKDFYALNNLSFNIKKGEVVGILGKNGSGKSTILKIITGILNQTSGNIKVNGKVTALLELGAGFNPELNGLENIELSTTIMGFSKDEISEKLEEIIEFAQIGEFLYQPIKTYSSGMKARLGFSLAISVEPEILIIDEALSVGDVAFQRKCYAKIEHLCKDDGTTVLFVSHSSSAVKQLCSRAIMLHNGEKVLDGNAKDVVNMYDKFMGDTKLDIVKIKKEYNDKISLDINKIKESQIQNQINYNPNMISQSVTKYTENGARISNIKVLNLNNKECNILEFNEEYEYSYTVTFLENNENIKLAMFIKNKTGLEITGKGIPVSEKNILSVKKGQVFHIKWKFKNIFNEGFYFFNCGVNCTNYGEKVILHRIIDGYMVRSVKEIDNYSKGIVDIDIRLNIKEIIN